MKIKSLLLGSAAALVAAPAAYAADVIVPEPEMVEYVRVCDMYGTGYFYIPGTETCLKISGYARFQVQTAAGGYDAWYDEGGSKTEFYSKASLNITASSETEYGTLTGFIQMNASSGYSEGGEKWYNEGDDKSWSVADSAGAFNLEQVYIEMAGLRMGYFYHWLDSGIAGETDSQGYNSLMDSVRYQADMGTWRAGVSIDEPNGWLHDTRSWGPNHTVLGVSGMVGGTMGPLDVEVVGYYDLGAEEGGVRGIAKADIGMGSLQALGMWNSGASGYMPYRAFGWGGSTHDNTSYPKWLVAAAYAAQINDKLTVTPGYQYAKFYEDDWGGSHEESTMWRAGVTVDYQIATNFATKVSLQYSKFKDDEVNNPWDEDYHAWDFFWRFERGF